MESLLRLIAGPFGGLNASPSIYSAVTSLNNDFRLFSFPIFFIIFRETLEAAIIISVLLSLLEQIMFKAPTSLSRLPSHTARYQPLPTEEDEERPQADSIRRRPTPQGGQDTPTGDDDSLTAQEESLTPGSTTEQLVRRLKLQIFLGAGLGFLTALTIGASLITIYFRTLGDQWSKAEEIWEGLFSVLGAFLILVMALAMLRMDRAKEKWKAKLDGAFAGERRGIDAPASTDGSTPSVSGKSSQYSLFLLPFITVLREGLEAVVFVAGLALTTKDPGSIPTAVVLGILAGVIVGLGIYFSGKKSSLSWFLVISTNILLLIGAGLMSNAVGAYERYRYNQLVGGDASESGDGPGSFPVDGNIWHLPCCNPENKIDGEAWSTLGSLIGWNNNGTVYTIAAYMIYWACVIVSLNWMRWKEGRIAPFGWESAAGHQRRRKRTERLLSERRLSGDSNE